MDAVAALRRAAPYAIVLALALAAVLALGAHLSNAQPSESRPFGWEGPAKFTNGVAMVRDDLVLVVTLPALLLGVRGVGDLAPGRDRARDLGARLALHAASLVVAVGVGTAAGVAAADPTTANAIAVFFLAHALLAVAFLALGALVGALVARPAFAAAVGVWLALAVRWERVVRLALYRNVGYDRLAAGDFPTWFYASEALSPLSAYRGVLVLGERGFMDWLERAVLGDAALPSYVAPETFAAALVVVWIAVPVAGALAAWRWRGRPRTRAARRAEPSG